MEKRITNLYEFIFSCLTYWPDKFFEQLKYDELKAIRNLLMVHDETINKHDKRMVGFGI